MGFTCGLGKKRWSLSIFRGLSQAQQHHCKDWYPLPRIDESLDRLSGAKWFSTLDLCSGYWQVEMNVDSKEKTAFTIKSGLCQFKVMPFFVQCPGYIWKINGIRFQGTSLWYLSDILGLYYSDRTDYWRYDSQSDKSLWPINGSWV